LGHAWKSESQPQFLALFSVEQALPSDHPIRAIMKLVDLVLGELSLLFDSMYSIEGRPSIPPERLLKAKLLIALHTMRSERQFCEQLHYNLLFRWFLDMDMSGECFDASTFSQNQERLIRHDAAHLFFHHVFELSWEHGWASDYHFTVDDGHTLSARSLPNSTDSPTRSLPVLICVFGSIALTPGMYPNDFSRTPCFGLTAAPLAPPTCRRLSPD